MERATLAKTLGISLDRATERRRVRFTPSAVARERGSCRRDPEPSGPGPAEGGSLVQGSGGLHTLDRGTGPVKSGGLPV